MRKVMTMVMAIVMVMMINVTAFAGVFTGKEEPKFHEVTEFNLNQVITGAESKIVKDGDRGVTRVDGTVYIWEVKDGVMSINSVDKDGDRVDYQLGMVTNGDEYRAYITVDGEDLCIDVTDYFREK